MATKALTNFIIISLLTSFLSLYLTGCGQIKKPSEGSLMNAFENDLLTYGYDSCSGTIMYKPVQDCVHVPFDYPWQKKGPFEWMSEKSGTIWRGGIKSKTIKVSKTIVIENNSDMFPYRGSVVWILTTKFKSASSEDILSSESKGSTEYLFGKKTKSWVQKETVTP